jgi:hypothetical protein
MPEQKECQPAPTLTSPKPFSNPCALGRAESINLIEPLHNQQNRLSSLPQHDRQVYIEVAAQDG